MTHATFCETGQGENKVESTGKEGIKQAKLPDSKASMQISPPPPPPPPPYLSHAKRIREEVVELIVLCSQQRGL